MPVTQIDLATLAPKTQETLPVKTAETQKLVNDNLNAYAQVEKNVHDSSDTTIRPKQSDTPEFRYDSTGGGNNGLAPDQKQPKGSKKKKEPKKLPTETEQEKKYGRGIDIRV